MCFLISDLRRSRYHDHGSARVGTARCGAVPAWVQKAETGRGTRWEVELAGAGRGGRVRAGGPDQGHSD